MKKTTQAIKYALDELHVTPDKLFQLIESAQGYDGSNYELWLAGRIIKIADSEGIPFTELLVKKLKILASLMSDSSEGISELVSKHLESHIADSKKVYDFSGIGFEGTTDLVDEFDWFNGVDLVDGTLGENNESDVAYVGYLDSKGIGKSEISITGKSMGYPIKSKGAGMLLRFILMDDFYQSEDNTYIFISDSAFFKENTEITQQFMSRFDLHSAVYLNKTDTMEGSFASGQDLITVWKTYSDSSVGVMQDLRFQDKPVISASSLVKGGNYKLFYADPSLLMEEMFYSSPEDVVVEVDSVNLDLEVSDKVEVAESELGGYLSLNGTQRVSDSPIKDSRGVVPVNWGNISDIIVFYGVSQSSEGTWGYGQGIGQVLDGLEGYDSLVANCLPIFLFGWNSLFHSSDDKVSNFTHDSELVADLFEKYSAFMSFEAKVLWDLGTEYSKAMQKGDDSLKGKTFYQIRNILADDSFEAVYKQKLESAQNYVREQVKGFLC